MHQATTQMRQLEHVHSDLDELRDLIEVDEARRLGLLAAAEGDLIRSIALPWQRW